MPVHPAPAAAGVQPERVAAGKLTREPTTSSPSSPRPIYPSREAACPPRLFSATRSAGDTPLRGLSRLSRRRDEEERNRQQSHPAASPGGRIVR